MHRKKINPTHRGGIWSSRIRLAVPGHFSRLPMTSPAICQITFTPWGSFPSICLPPLTEEFVNFFYKNQNKRRFDMLRGYRTGADRSNQGARAKHSQSYPIQVSRVVLYEINVWRQFPVLLF